ncbi:MAG: TorF family putative porin [Halorhodospira halophila]|uniref:TorF family putative porin n=1 Tax=Halorhodospira halophila TaxID=1053 RepID=UPI0026EB7483|nr:TorF family putative porin [Halorhodospira halophila]MCC3751115.1 TorF family putative porin [Halorhodospira halophila]
MKKPFPLVTAGGLLLGLSANAQAEEIGAGWSLSSNVAITSNYLFRGFSESGEEPAVQGGFDLDHASGAYVGTWASSLGPDAAAALEMDYYGGFGFDLTPDIWGDVGLVFYTYPEDTDDNTVEIYAGAGTAFGEVEADFYAHISDDYFDSDESSVYLETNWMTPLAAGFYAMAHLGYLVIDSDTDADGFDAALGVGYEYGTLDLSLVGTYNSSDEADDADEETQVAFTVSRSF